MGTGRAGETTYNGSRALDYKKKALFPKRLKAAMFILRLFPSPGKGGRRTPGS